MTVVPQGIYKEIGIYCFGRGIFHKAPRRGFEVGDKDLFLMKEGDFILQVTFAWEGAVAIVSPAEDGLYGSTRFPTFRVDQTRCVPLFLLNYFRTTEGVQQLVNISPGSAGRNRVLSMRRIPEVLVPLPPMADQRRLVERIDTLAGLVAEAKLLRHESAEELSQIMSRTTASSLDAVDWERKPLGDILSEPPRNGLSPKPKVTTGGRPMLRINAVSSSPTRMVDLRAVKRVDVSDGDARPFELEPDDVFIVRYNGDINRVAKPAIFKAASRSRFVFPDKLIRLRPAQEKMLPDFLVFALNARSVHEQVEELGKTTAGNIGVSGANIKSFIVSIPPIPDQRRIVAHLDDVQMRLDAGKVLQAETAAELDALMPAVLDRAFKGEF